MFARCAGSASIAPAGEAGVIFMNNMQTNWEIMFMLPNLGLSEAIGNDKIAIVPKSDQRVDEIVSTSSIAKSLVENFEDQFGRSVNPALLLIGDNVPNFMREIDTIVGVKESILTLLIDGKFYMIASL